MEIWEKAIDTQMHFNEMSVRTRQLGLSFVVAALGVVVVLLTNQEARLELRGVSSHVAGPILVLVAVGLYAVRTLDLGVYHRMLRGAVAFNESFESKHFKNRIMQVPSGLTETVSLYSRYPDAKNTGDKGKKQTAEQRVSSFYWTSIAVLVIFGILLTLALGKIATKRADAKTDDGRQTHSALDDDAGTN